MVLYCIVKLRFGVNEKPSCKLGQMAIYFTTEFINKLHVVKKNQQNKRKDFNISCKQLA